MHIVLVYTKQIKTQTFEIIFEQHPMLPHFMVPCLLERHIPPSYLPDRHKPIWHMNYIICPR